MGVVEAVGTTEGVGDELGRGVVVGATVGVGVTDAVGVIEGVRVTEGVGVGVIEGVGVGLGWRQTSIREQNDSMTRDRLPVLIPRLASVVACRMYPTWVVADQSVPSPYMPPAPISD